MLEMELQTASPKSASTSTTRLWTAKRAAHFLDVLVVLSDQGPPTHLVLKGLRHLQNLQVLQAHLNLWAMASCGFRRLERAQQLSN